MNAAIFTSSSFADPMVDADKHLQNFDAFVGIKNRSKPFSASTWRNSEKYLHALSSIHFQLLSSLVLYISIKLQPVAEFFKHFNVS